MENQETKEHKLTLHEVLRMLVADGMVGKTDADALGSDKRMRRHDIHPLVVVADQNWKSQLPPNKLLNLETLTE